VARGVELLLLVARGVELLLLVARGVVVLVVIASRVDGMLVVVPVRIHTSNKLVNTFHTLMLQNILLQT